MNPTSFETFLQNVDRVKSTQDCSRLDPAREALLQSPSAAWALAFISADRMRGVLQTPPKGKDANLSWVQADIVYRPFSVVMDETKQETKLAAQMRTPPTPQSKAQARMREANALLEKLTGEAYDAMTPAGLARIVGPDTPLIAELGGKGAAEVLGLFLSIKDPNVLLPVCETMKATLKTLENSCSDYHRWKARRDVVAKGEKKGLLGKKKVNTEDLAKLDARLADMRESNPHIGALDVFREACLTALPAHGKKPKTDDMPVQLIEHWTAVETDNAEWAGFTIRKRNELKQEQLSRGAGGTGDTNRREGFNTQSAKPDDSAETPGMFGDLLEQEDIDAFRRKHEQRKPK